MMSHPNAIEVCWQLKLENAKALRKKNRRNRYLSFVAYSLLPIAVSLYAYSIGG